jgi:tetratricopeptide (TPR) repeat protein
MAVRLTLCLIARNEESMLPGCLAAAAGVVDEVVLVDTGSTDRTREIARSAGATVLERAWDDDFAAPRNLAIEQSHGDWVLVLDADERLARGAGQVIRQALRRPAFDVGFLRFHNASRSDVGLDEVVGGAARAGESYSLPRLLRRLPDLRYHGSIHENVNEWAAAHGNRYQLLPADVVHLGYVGELQGSLAKRDRNLALLRRRMAQEPDDISAYGYVAQELFQRGEVAEAEAVAARAWALVPTQPRHRSLRRVVLVRATVAVQRGQAEVALEALDEVERREASNPDYALLRGMAEEVRAFAAPPGSGARAAGLESAIASYRRALQLLADRQFLQVLLMEEPLGLIRLGGSLLALDRWAEAAEVFARAEHASGGLEASVGRAEAIARQGDATAALALLEPLLRDRPEPWLVAALAASFLGAAGDGRLFLSRATNLARAGYAAPRYRELHRELAARLGGGA